MDQPIGGETKKAVPDYPFSEREKNVIIAGVLLSMLLAALDQAIVAPALPTMAEALGNAEYLPWIVTGYLLTATAVAPLYGKISDVRGRRPTIFAAVLIFLAGSAIAAMAPNMLVLIAGRAVQGLGGGGLFAMTQTVIGDLVPPLERARYAAWISGTWAVASIAGPLLGGAFAEHLHWSLIFWINIPLGLVAMAIINNPLKKLPVSARHHSIDGWGALLLVLATSLLLLAMNWGGSRYAWASPEIGGLVAASAVLWSLFALRLTRAQEPLISLEVLANRIVLTATMTMFMLQAASIGLAVYLPVYLQAQIGLSPADAGMAMLGLLLGTVAGATVSGTLVPRFTHYKRIALAGVLFAVAGLCVLGALADTVSLASIEFITTGIGFGIGTALPISTVSVQNAVDRAHLGVATGVMTFVRSLGGAIGVAALGAVALGSGLPLAGEGGQAHAAHAGAVASFSVIFFATAVLVALGLALLTLMPEKPLRGYDTPIITE